MTKLLRTVRQHRKKGDLLIMENRTKLDAETHAYIKSNWEFLAAKAWDGYKPNEERGVIVINMSLKLDVHSEHSRAFYMMSTTSERFEPETDEWVRQFVFKNQAKLDSPQDQPEIGKPMERFGGWYDYVYSYDPNREVVFIGLREGDDPGIEIVSYTPTPKEASELQKERRVD